MMSESELAGLRRRGDLLFENSRYGNRYAVDRSRLQSICESGSIPVVHLGQVAGVRALRSSFPAQWLSALLWCSRETSSVRVLARQAGATSRVAAWDETARDIEEHGTEDFAMSIDTSRPSRRKRPG
ncbi:MAG: hypothetical protein GEV09_12880 [Pseudonocardiaceae bacterium]|nr:hypothetical protein [Pseudonocardiaceae bacterium]